MIPLGTKKQKLIGIIGDIHAEDNLLAKSISFLLSKHVDSLFCVGDLLDGRGDADRCFGKSRSRIVCSFGELTIITAGDRLL